MVLVSREKLRSFTWVDGPFAVVGSECLVPCSSRCLVFRVSIALWLLVPGLYVEWLDGPDEWFAECDWLPEDWLPEDW